MQRVCHRWIAAFSLSMVGLAPAVMFNRDTGSAKSVELANLPPFASRAGRVLPVLDAD